MATQEKSKRKQLEEETTDSSSSTDKKRIKLERSTDEAKEAQSTSASSFSLSIENPEGKVIVWYI